MNISVSCNISNPTCPFALGILINEFKINSLKENSDTDFCYKSIYLSDLNIFMDCSESFEELKYEKLIDNSIKEMISEQMTTYLGESLNFYSYCLTELNKDLNHQYILYKLNMDMKITMNYNLDNNNPKYQLHSNEIEYLLFKCDQNQISNFFLQS